MTKKDAKAIRELLEELGWSQETAAEKLGVGLRTMQRYCSGEASVPYTVTMALRWLQIVQGNEKVIEFIDKHGARLAYVRADGGEADITGSEIECLRELNSKLRAEVKKLKNH